MEKKSNAPTSRGGKGGAMETGNKGKPIFLNGQLRLLKLFRQGGKYSAADISSILKLCDPRSHIRCLRNKGLDIGDVWIKAYNVRYKLYFLKGSGNDSGK